MSASFRNSKAERAGRWLGRASRALVRQEARVTRWMIDNGMSPRAAAAVLWIVRIGILAILMYVVFWLALVIAFAWVAATLAQHANQDPEQPVWEPNDPTDHRNSLSYDPINFNDDPDPRFEEE